MGAVMCTHTRAWEMRTAEHTVEQNFPGPNAAALCYIDILKSKFSYLWLADHENLILR